MFRRLIVAGNIIEWRHYARELALIAGGGKGCLSAVVFLRRQKCDRQVKLLLEVT